MVIMNMLKVVNPATARLFRSLKSLFWKYIFWLSTLISERAHLSHTQGEVLLCAFYVYACTLDKFTLS